MGHPRWPGFNDKTGNPIVDNANRNFNRNVWASAKRVIGVTAKSRKRRKQIKRVEGGNYIKLIVAVANDLARKDAS